MTRNWLILFLLFTCAELFGQEQPPQELLLTKELPVNVRLSHLSLCKSYSEVRCLADSLQKEGFQILDSAEALTIAKTFFEHTFSYRWRHNYQKTVEENKAYVTQEFASKKLYQELMINSNSCLDTQHNYTVSISMFPRLNEKKSLSFTFPLDSPYSVTTVILSLIKR